MIIPSYSVVRGRRRDMHDAEYVSTSEAGMGNKNEGFLQAVEIRQLILILENF